MCRKVGGNFNVFCVIFCLVCHILQRLLIYAQLIVVVTTIVFIFIMHSLFDTWVYFYLNIRVELCKNFKSCLLSHIILEYVLIDTGGSCPWV